MDKPGQVGEELAPLQRGLVMAVLGDACLDVQQADHVIEAARGLDVDVLDYCAHRFGLGDALVAERAADWAGYAYWHQMPALANSGFDISRIDLLAGVRTLRASLLGRDVSFYAPRFDQLINLSQALLQNPRLRQRICIIPARAIRTALTAAHATLLLDEARQRLNRRWPAASADVDLPASTRITFVSLFLAAAGAATIAPFFLSELMLPLIAALFVTPAIVRLAAAIMPQPPRKAARPLSDFELPTYTVLIPLRDEAEMVPQLHRAMSRIDYPPEKLDVKFVVEANSPTTIKAVQALLPDPRYEIVIVPDSAPRTKPKALNFALPLARGAHLVVYDAEDIPDPNQLRLAANRFAADPRLDCVQAELVVENAAESWISAMFAGEYAGQFGLMLPFLGRFGLPMPLGGTSNHFRVASLRMLGHWDAFNVTEDADLGVRLSRLRYYTDTLASDTREEAPITLSAWMNQRTRWMKGWMQTFIVHNRSMGAFLSDIGWRNFLFFQVYVGGLILSALLHTMFMAGFIVRAALGLWPQTTGPIEVAYAVVMIVGYAGPIALVIAGLARRGSWELIPLQILLPVYWLFHSVASLRAAHQLLVRPYFWGKTAHGRTRQPRTFAG